MDVETTARLACGNLRGEGHIQAVFVSEVADNPFGQHQLVGGILHVRNQELYFVLFVNLVIQREVAHFGVAVFDLAAHLSDIKHALGTELLELGERCGFMVTFLVGCLVQFLFVANDVVFQFAHCLEFHARHFLERLDRLAENIFWGVFHRETVLIEIGTEERKGGDGGEGVNEGGFESGNHIHIAGACVDECGEDVGSVHAFAAGKNLFEIFAAMQNKIERFQTAITRYIAEINHFDVIFLHKLYHIRLGKFIRRFFQKVHYRVHRHRTFFFHNKI